ncbi:MAG TPA: DHH family phosphoesterase [Thermoplasmata archaeon]|nr:DHH family phosphoesterase [Thermoplasmata archaeon]
MPSGPDTFVSDPHYQREFERARALVLAHPRRWRVIYHYDADGIASASSAVRAFGRLGYPVQATPLLGVERDRVRALLTATKGPVLIADTGASWLDLYPSHPFPVVILDHHKYPGVPNPPELPPHVAFVNPLDWGVDGMSELCAATLTWLFTVFLDPVNWDNAAWGLSGAIGDRQHVGGFRGLNGILVEEAVRRSVLERRPGIALLGTTMGAALASAIDPFVRGLSGHRATTDAFLRGLSIDPESSPTSLAPEPTSRLVSALQKRLEGSGVLPEFVAVLDQERWFLPSHGMDAEELSNLQSATGRAGIPGVGVAMALGDATAFDRARTAETAWREGILRGLLRIEEKGVHSKTALCWFESPETTLAGTQAGMAMNYLLPPDRPVLVFSDGGTGPTKVSGRGTLRLVDRGLDLATALRTAANAVGGEGGGHRVASGATIPPGTRDQFLEVADRAIADQLKVGGDR